MGAPVPLRACPRCGSTDLSIPGVGDGVVPETDNLAEWVCQECDLKAVPLEFADKHDLRAFRETLEPWPESE